MTVNFDERHVLKRLREAVKSPTRGVKIGNVTLFKASIEQWLGRTACPNIVALLQPEDAMNVTAARELIYWLGQVKHVRRESIPAGSEREWEAVKLLGELGELLLTVFDPEPSLAQQLSNLSKLGFLLVYLDFATKAHTKLMPNQLYHDMQAVVKNAFFCTVKVRLVYVVYIQHIYIF